MEEYFKNKNLGEEGDYGEEDQNIQGDKQVELPLDNIPNSNNNTNNNINNNNNQMNLNQIWTI